MEKGQFLYFIPPKLADNENGEKYKRYMLIVENNKEDNTIKMINVSSTKNKEHKLLYPSNKEIDNYYPLRVPTFAKLDTLYTIDYFKELENYVMFNKQKLSDEQFNDTNNQRLQYMKSNSIEIIQYTENEFKELNNTSDKP